MIFHEASNENVQNNDIIGGEVELGSGGQEMAELLQKLCGADIESAYLPEVMNMEAIVETVLHNGGKAVDRFRVSLSRMTYGLGHLARNADEFSAAGKYTQEHFKKMQAIDAENNNEREGKRDWNEQEMLDWAKHWLRDRADISQLAALALAAGYITEAQMQPYMSQDNRSHARTDPEVQAQDDQNKAERAEPEQRLPEEEDSEKSAKQLKTKNEDIEKLKSLKQERSLRRISALYEIDVNADDGNISIDEEALAKRREERKILEEKGYNNYLDSISKAPEERILYGRWNNPDKATFAASLGRYLGTDITLGSATEPRYTNIKFHNHFSVQWKLENLNTEEQIPFGIDLNQMELQEILRHYDAIMALPEEEKEVVCRTWRRNRSPKTLIQPNGPRQPLTDADSRTLRRVEHYYNTTISPARVLYVQTFKNAISSSSCIGFAVQETDTQGKHYVRFYLEPLILEPLQMIHERPVPAAPSNQQNMARPTTEKVESRERARASSAIEQIKKADAKRFAEALSWYLSRFYGKEISNDPDELGLQRVENPRPTTNLFHNSFSSPFIVTDPEIKKLLRAEQITFGTSFNHLEIEQMRRELEWYDQHPEEPNVYQGKPLIPAFPRRIFGNADIRILRKIEQLYDISVEPKDVLYVQGFRDSERRTIVTGIAIIRNNKFQLLFDK